MSLSFHLGYLKGFMSLDTIRVPFSKVDECHISSLHTKLPLWPQLMTALATSPSSSKKACELLITRNVAAMAFEKGPQNKETDTADIFKLSKHFYNCRQPNHIHSVFRKTKFDCRLQTTSTAPRKIISRPKFCTQGLNWAFYFLWLSLLFHIFFCLLVPWTLLDLRSFFSTFLGFK